MILSKFKKSKINSGCSSKGETPQKEGDTLIIKERENSVARKTEGILKKEPL